jgi:signal transduction histidine kinase
MNEVHRRPGRGRYAKYLRVGLPLKSVLILVFVVVGVTAAGGWFYFDTARTWLRSSDRRQAERMGRGVGLAAQVPLLDQRNMALQRLVGEVVGNDSVRYVVILDAQGRVAAEASRDPDGWQWSAMAHMPLSVSAVNQVTDDLLTFAEPVVARAGPDGEDRLVGAVRIVLDTSATTENLARVERRVWLIAACGVLCAIPVGYLLVWRLLVQPVRRLAGATRRLAGGDFAARAGLHRNDEIGELAASFDTMAEELNGAREKLLRANEQLEQKVAERTDELRRTNARLRDEMAEKEDFLRAVSHDLSAPLRNIAGMATMVMIKWRDVLPEEVIARLQRIQANVDTESLLIGELLELSRVKTRPQKRQVVDFGALLDDVAAAFEFELKNRNTALTVRRPMPSLYVEKSRMRQVFQNLIDNAIKYMHRSVGGRIDVGCELADGMHRFYVADNGPGIPAGEQQKIFYVFRRVENAATAKVPGKGVGLALVRSIVANYDGQAYVQSEEGVGSTFYVTLSAACTQPPDGEQGEAAETPRAVEEVHNPVG